MPITQPRIISILNAATDFQIAFEEACKLVQHARRQVLDGHQSAEEALSHLTAEIRRSARLRDPDNSGSILTSEIRYYKLNLKRNDRARIKAHRRRHEGQMPPVRISTAPRSISLPTFIHDPYADPTALSGLTELDREVEEALQSRTRSKTLTSKTLTSKTLTAPMTPEDQSKINKEIEEALARYKLEELNKPKEAFGIEDLLDTGTADKGL